MHDTYNREFMSANLGSFLEPAATTEVAYDGLFPEDLLIMNPPKSLPAWHLVGRKDPVLPSEISGEEPEDGYPVLLSGWVRRDGLSCLKVKLRGDDAGWDYARLDINGPWCVTFEWHEGEALRFDLEQYH